MEQNNKGQSLEEIAEAKYPIIDWQSYEGKHGEETNYTEYLEYRANIEAIRSAFIAGAKAMQESAVGGGWVSVKESGLPQSLLNHIVFYDDGITGYVSRGFHSNGVWDVCSYRGTIHPKVTHYKPLPQPPTQTEGNQ